METGEAQSKTIGTSDDLQPDALCAYYSEGYCSLLTKRFNQWTRCQYPKAAMGDDSGPKCDDFQTKSPDA